MVVVVSVSNCLHAIAVSLLDASMDRVNKRLSLREYLVLVQFQLPQLSNVLPETACRVELHVMIVGDCRYYSEMGFVKSIVDTVIYVDILLLDDHPVELCDAHLFVLLFKYCIARYLFSKLG